MGSVFVPENEDLRAKIQADLGVDAGERDYLPFKGLEKSVRTDVQIVKDSELIPNDIPVHGYVYEVCTQPAPTFRASQPPGPTPCSQWQGGAVIMISPI